MGTINSAASIRVPWNKGKLVGQKAPFKLKEIWAIRVRLRIASRCRELALILQQKTQRPVQFEITEPTRNAASAWIKKSALDTTSYGTHTLRRTKATLIYRRTKNLRAVQLLLGHSKLESTVRYLGIEVDDALEMAEQTDV